MIKIKTWKTWVILGLAIALGLTLWLDSPKPVPEVVLPDIVKIKQEVVDSIKHQQNESVVAKLDSVRDEYEIKLKRSETNIVNLKEKLAKQKAEYKADTSVQSPPCDSVIKTSEIIIDSLDFEVSVLVAIRENMLLKIGTIEADKKITESSLLASYAENDRLKKTIKKQTNWWNRNDKWIYFAGGIILTYLISK